MSEDPHPSTSPATSAPSPDYLDGGLSAAGRPRRRAARRRPSGRRPVWWGVGVLVLAGLGAGAWAALGFFRQGAQPAEALPSTTVAYVAVDLHPAGGQKIDAFRTLRRFPSYRQHVGIGSVDELRRRIGEQLVAGTHCPALDYARDVAPWLGDRMAAAVVPLGGRPHLVAVLQVTDEAAARAGIARVEGCPGSAEHGFVVKDGWAVIAESQPIADGVVVASDRATLAHDATFRRWTRAAGPAGVVNAYLAPAVGSYASGGLSDLLSRSLVAATSPATSSLRASLAGSAPSSSSFRGAAATLRFTGGGVELAVAAGPGPAQLSQLAGSTGGRLVQRLPGDTGAALGLTFPPGSVRRELIHLARTVAGDAPPRRAMRELSRSTGLRLPGDLETLLGSGVALSVGPSLDPQAVADAASPVGLPLAVSVRGDPAAIERVLGRLRARLPDPALLGSDSAGGLEVVGPTPAYRRQVLAGGTLGSGDAFRGVVPDASAASAVAYVDLEALAPALDRALGGDQQLLTDLHQLRALGASAWEDHGVLRLSLTVITR